MGKKILVLLTMLLLIFTVSCGKNELAREIENRVYDIKNEFKDKRYVKVEITKILTEGRGFDEIKSKTTTLTLDRDTSEVVSTSDYFNSDTQELINDEYEKYAFDFEVPKSDNILYDEDSKSYTLIIDRERYKSKYTDLYNLFEMPELTEEELELKIIYYNPSLYTYKYMILGSRETGEPMQLPFIRTIVKVSYTD